MANCFVGLPKTRAGKLSKTSLYKKKPNGDMETFRHVLWGDWLHLAPDDPADPAPQGWVKVIWKPNSETPETVFIKKDHTAETRPLEIIFVDVGQGDGAVLITPERDDKEAILVIDAGKHDHMQEFLSARFNTYKTDMQFTAAIITHPDEDHYGGFKYIFQNQFTGFDTVYQSGLVERPAGAQYEKLGGLVEDPVTGIFFIQELATTRQDIEAAFSDESTFGNTKFPPVMHAALNNVRVGDFAMLSTEHGKKEQERTWLPGFAPSQRPDYQIEVVGPVVEKDSNGKPGLRRITSNYNKTKNGHSVLLRLHIGGFKVLFGGDLNRPAEQFLLKHFAGLDVEKPLPRKRADRKKMIEDARKTFGADIMKVCHHGASDVTDEFIETVEPAAFVISSGDEEGHVHPRPDLLGRLGKLGRGESPVLLSTELQRSTREKADAKLVFDLLQQVNGLTKKPTVSQIESITGKIDALGRSNVSVFGSIYVKTDGTDLVVAFKKETNSQKDKWFTFHYRIVKTGDGESVLKLMD